MIWIIIGVFICLELFIGYIAICYCVINFTLANRTGQYRKDMLDAWYDTGIVPKTLVKMYRSGKLK